MQLLGLHFDKTALYFLKLGTVSQLFILLVHYIIEAILILSIAYCIVTCIFNCIQ